MTKLEWLAKMPRDEALKILLNYCPYHSRDGKCPEDGLRAMACRNLWSRQESHDQLLVLACGRTQG